MLFNQSREQLRKLWLDAWQGHLNNRPLSPLEHELVNIIRLHPEYHSLFENEDKLLSRDYLPEQGETNPFLHMGMHQGIHEQLSSGRPKGIRKVYKALCTKYQDPHEAEHAMMDAFAETLWEAQRDAKMPDEQAYLKRLKKLLTKL